MRSIGRPLAMVILCVCISKIFPISKCNLPPSISAGSVNGNSKSYVMRNNDLELPPVVSWTICKTLPRLTKHQRSLCRKYPDVTLVALQGLEMAMQECQYQFRNHRWNCSSLSSKHRSPRNSALLKKGYREASFTNAISAAGITHSVAKACSMGKLTACGCEPTSLILKDVEAAATDETSDEPKRSHRQKLNRNRWKWGGCSHNMNFGIHFSALFLDGRDKQGGDLQSSINLHNYEAGRLAVSSQMQVRCKCHGMSGSCQLKTCWRSTPDFRAVGDELKERFRKAVLVNQSNSGNGSPLLMDNAVTAGRRRARWNNNNNSNNNKNNNNNNKSRKRKRRLMRQQQRRDLASDLLYYQKSPSFCEKDVAVDIAGTVGRVCNRTSRGMDNCSSLCCGRGYNIVKQKKTERCNCRFEWCCYVVCQNCTVNEWITICK